MNDRGALPRRPGSWPACLALAALGLTLGLSSLAFGYSDSRIWAPAGIVLAGVLGAVLVARSGHVRAAPTVVVGSLAGLGLWSLASSSWAPSAHQAGVEGNLLIVFAILLALLVQVVSDRTRAVWLLGGVLAGVTIVACLVIGRMTLLEDPRTMFAAGRLNEPLGYVNGQGSVFLLALFPTLALAEHPRSPLLAGLGAAGAALFAGLALLSGARGVLLAGALALGLVLLIVPGRLRRVAAILVVAAALVVAVPALTDVLSVRADPTKLDAAIRDAAAWLVLATVIAGLVWGAVTAFHARSPAQTKLRARALARGSLGIAAVAAIGAGLFFAGDIAQRADHAYAGFVGTDSAESEAEPGSRLASGGGARHDYWRVALDVWQDHKLAGIGAGGWAGAYLLERKTTEDVRQPHSLPLQTLAELGLVGVALLAIAFGALLRVLLRRARAPGPPSLGVQSLLVAGIGVGAAWAIHTSVDWIHLIPGATGMAICAAAVVLGAGSPATARSAPRWVSENARWPLAAAAAVLLAVATFTLTRQALAEHFRARGEQALASRPSSALELANRSLRFQDDAVPTYYLKAAGLARTGDGESAEAVMSEALRREPANFVSHTLLGDLRVRRGDVNGARRAYERASRLKPLDVQLREQARDPRKALEADAAPAAAPAQEEVLSVDPDSPSAKQFGDAVETVRRDAARAAGVRLGRHIPSERSAPPFGVGVGSSARAPEPRGPAGEGVPMNDAGDSRSDGGPLTIVGVAALVLMSGLCAGLALRRPGPAPGFARPRDSGAGRLALHAHQREQQRDEGEAYDDPHPDRR